MTDGALEPSEVLARIMALAPPLAAEDVLLHAVMGDRVLAKDLVAALPYPGFDHAAMDGFAVRADDAGPRRVAGEARAGGPEAQCGPREAVRIFTGAPIPKGADAVVPQERVEAIGDEARLDAAPTRGQHIRWRGEDIEVGAPLLEAGTVLSPGTLAVLASQGQTTAPVTRRPRVAVLATGDELERGQADLVTPMLVAAVAEAGGEIVARERAGDRPDALDDSLKLLFGASPDAIITSGGVSVGAYDGVRAAFARLGVRLESRPVRIKPGKPFTFGRREAAVLCLPGNPAAAFVVFQTFVRPFLRRLQGDAAPYPRRLSVRLEPPVTRERPTRWDLVRVDLSAPPVAVPFPRQGSGALSSLAASGVAMVPPGAAKTRAAFAFGFGRGGRTPLFDEV